MSLVQRITKVLDEHWWMGETFVRAAGCYGPGCEWRGPSAAFNGHVASLLVAEFGPQQITTGEELDADWPMGTVIQEIHTGGVAVRSAATSTRRCGRWRFSADGRGRARCSTPTTSRRAYLSACCGARIGAPNE